MTKFLNPPKRFKFSDDIMFSLIMQNEDICRDVLTVILGEKIGKIKHLVTQNTIANKADRKYIRVDVSVETENGKLYDIEMQTTSHKSLPQRMRLYQAMMDVNTVQLRQSYKSIPDNFVIFICNFDFFERDAPLYICRNLCENVERLPLNDGTYKIVVNATAFADAKSEKLASFLCYVNTNEPSDELTRRIDTMVNSNAYQMSALEGFMTQFSTFEMDARDEARAEGAYQKACETARRLLVKGLSVTEIADITDLSEEEILAL